RLAGDSQAEKQKRDRVAASARAQIRFFNIRFQEEEDRQQIKEGRLRILEFGDPGDRFDHHRMKRPKRGAKPRTGNTELAQHAPKQNRRAGVDENIEEMIWKRVKTDEFVEKPKGGQDERIIISVARRPNFLETERADDARVVRQVRIIVPNEAGTESVRV